MKNTFFISALSLLLALQGCKIIQVSEDGGSIVSRTTTHDCGLGLTCTIDVEDGAVFSDTFTAVPKSGYVFTGWKEAHKHLFGGSMAPAALEGVPGDFTAVAVDLTLYAQFETNALLGSWLLADGSNHNVFTFIDNNHYVLVHNSDGGGGGDQVAGSLEYGSYQWNAATGAFTINSIITNSDGDGGLSDDIDNGVAFGFQVSGDTLSLTVNGEPAATLIRIVSNDVQGAWGYLRGATHTVDEYNILTILNDTEYVIAHVIAGTSEWGTYTWNASSKEFSTQQPSVETDGEDGLFDGASTVATANIDSNGSLALLFNDEESVTFLPLPR